jgi:hypothetical protein
LHKPGMDSRPRRARLEVNMPALFDNERSVSYRNALKSPIL